MNSIPRSIIINGRDFINNNKPFLFKGTNVTLKGPPWLPSTDNHLEPCNDKQFIGCSLNRDKYNSDLSDDIINKQDYCYNIKNKAECDNEGEKGCISITKGEGSPFCKGIPQDSNKWGELCGKTCYSFNEFDIMQVINAGHNSIRLGIPWQGAQPELSNGLDMSLDEYFIRRLHNILKLCEKHNIQVLLNNHGDMVSPLSCGFGMPAWLSLLIPKISVPFELPFFILIDCG